MAQEGEIATDAQVYSDKFMKLTLRVQLLAEPEIYLSHFIEEYEARLKNVRMFLDSVDARYFSNQLISPRSGRA